ncbi:unnamed protein product, partial [Didymodactylos carnosus]
IELPLYAANKVPEYWAIDCGAELVRVRKNPNENIAESGS